MAADDLGDHVGARPAALFLERHPAVHDPRQALLAVADDEQVDERGQHFGVLGAGAAGDDQRMVERAVLGVQRDAAEVEHGQNVRIADLVLQTEAEEVEVAQRREGFQAVQRQPGLAQHGLEIDPRGEGAFAGPLRIVVHQRVEDLQAVVAGADGIGVGEAEAQAAAHPAMVLGDAVEFAAAVLGRRLDARQQAEDRFLQRGVHHRRVPFDCAGRRLHGAVSGSHPRAYRIMPERPPRAAPKLLWTLSGPFWHTPSLFIKQHSSATAADARGSGPARHIRREEAMRRVGAGIDGRGPVGGAGGVGGVGPGHGRRPALGPAPQPKSWWDGWFGRPPNRQTRGKKPEAAAPPAPAAPSPVELAAAARQRERADFNRRMEVCDRLTEIAVQNNDAAMQIADRSTPGPRLGSCTRSEPPTCRRRDRRRRMTPLRIGRGRRNRSTGHCSASDGDEARSCGR